MKTRILKIEDQEVESFEIFCSTYKIKISTKNRIIKKGKEIKKLTHKESEIVLDFMDFIQYGKVRNMKTGEWF